MAHAPRFLPGAIDYDGQMAVAYQAGRALSAEAARTWRTIVAPFVRAAPCPRLLDLGSGTGRFARVFAESFNIQVVGVEPAKGMRAAAASAARPGNLAYVGGGAENIPLKDESCGLAWLSCIWHHVRHRDACATELRRVLRREGQLLIRGAFGDHLDGFPTLFRYWPTTRRVCEQLPTIHETVRILEAGGFVLAEHRRIEQQTWPHGPCGCRGTREHRSGRADRPRRDQSGSLPQDRRADRAAVGGTAQTWNPQATSHSLVWPSWARISSST